VVVGHSFGGAVAVWLAVSNRERVRALVLAAPSANAESLRSVDRLLAAPGVGYVVGAAALAGAALATEPVRSRVARELELEDGYLRSAARMLRVRQLLVVGVVIRLRRGSSAGTSRNSSRCSVLIELERANHQLPRQRAPELAEMIVKACSA
jgi:pimeloyl-ACP methyl ester carboxylesterase